MPKVPNIMEAPNLFVSFPNPFSMPVTLIYINKNYLTGKLVDNGNIINGISKTFNDHFSSVGEKSLIKIFIYMHIIFGMLGHFPALHYNIYIYIYIKGI